MTRNDRMFLMWRAQKKSRAMEGWNTRGAVFDVARQFKVSCEEVRRVLEDRRT